jgi:hypothetical protein
MKKIIRLTESDLRGIVQRSVLRVLQEQNDFGLLLQSIAQSIVQKGEIDVNPGENDLEVELQDGRLVYIKYNVLCSPYLRQGMKSNDYDVPDDPDEIIDDWDVEIIDICLYDYDDNEVTINDNGIVRKSIKRVLQIDYSNYDAPSEEDYFYYED